MLKPILRDCLPGISFLCKNTEYIYQQVGQYFYHFAFTSYISAMILPTLATYLDIVIRAIAVYLFILVAIRVFGKKELSQLSTSDLVLILLISNAVQNAMVGPDTSLLGGIIAAAALFLLNYLFKQGLFFFPKLTHTLEGDETMLIYKGKIIDEHLRKERITLNELQAVIREHGVGNVDDVELAVLERDGNISVVSNQLNGQTFHKRGKKLHSKQRRGSSF
jgi:uncharacterized membrane protein YcaP (DUF421 family)